MDAREFYSKTNFVEKYPGGAEAFDSGGSRILAHSSKAWLIARKSSLHTVGSSQGLSLVNPFTSSKLLMPWSKLVGVARPEIILRFS